MVPTLLGRIQTRWFLILVVGAPWTLFISYVGPRGPNPSLQDLYLTTYWVLLEVAIVGSLFWDPLYQVLMQFRWEKDWPIMFALLVGIPEGVLAYVLLVHVGPASWLSPPATTGWTFVVQFGTVWLLIWLTAVGPMRVLVPRWRYTGGRIV